MARITTLGAICALLLSGLCLAESSAVEYVDGTVLDIPSGTLGTLDLTDPEAFHFRYGSLTYSVPYGRISGYYSGRESDGVGSRIAGGAAKVGKTVLPMFFSKKKYLTIDFAGENNTGSQRMVLRLSADEANATLPVLEAATVAQAATDSSGYADTKWWGNRVWKTKRNRHLWPKTSPETDTQEQVEVAAGKE